MNMLINFIDTGFIITLGILILVTGAVMLYCYRRLNLLENSVIEHGKILQNFIMNYNNNQINNIGIPNFSLTQEANEANENIDIIETNNIYNEELNTGKIAVSDDDDDDDDEDDDDDDEDDDDDDDNEDDDDDDDSDNSDYSDNNDDKDEDDNIKKLDITSFEIEDNGLQLESIDNTDIKTNKLEDDFLNNLPINLENLNIASISMESKLINLGNDDEKTDIDNDNESVSMVGDLKKGFSKMKVDDLRALVVTKNLTDNDNSQKMKKNELIKMLQSN